MLVPVAPKSHSATMPRAGRPGAARSAVSAATASDTTGVPGNRAAQGVHDAVAPVRRDGDDRAFGPAARAGRAGQRFECVDDEALAAVR